MASYLSIDMDYFNPCFITEPSKDYPYVHSDFYPYVVENKVEMDVEEELRRLLCRAINRGIPVLAVMNHQQLLADVNASNATTLINLDTHADLHWEYTNVLDCGSWVSFVTWRHQGTYSWVRMQQSIEDGNCNGKLKWNGDTDWKKTKATLHTTSIKSFLRRDCVGIGLCLSPHYVKPSGLRIFREMVSEFKIPYKKGRIKEELVGRELRPSKRKP